MTQKTDLKDSEDIYREIFWNSMIGIVIYEAFEGGNDFIIKNLNPSAELIDRIERENVIGKRLKNVFPKWEESGFLSIIKRVWKTGKPEYYPRSNYKGQRISGLRENYIFRLPTGEVVVMDQDAKYFEDREVKLQKALQDSERRREEVSALLKATKSVLEYKDFTKTARAIFNVCKEITGAQSGYIALLTEDGSENEVLFLDSGGLPCSVDPELPMPIRGLRSEAYKTGNPVYDNDFMKSKWIEFLPKGHVTLNNVLFAPLNLDNKTIGLIGLANKASEFNENDARLASGLSELVAVALNNSMMIESLENSRKECMDAYDQTNLYKDLFTHDISNILQNLSYATHLLANFVEDPKNEETYSELMNLIEDQISRGSKLVSSIRKLSKVELIERKLEKVNITKTLKKAIKFTKESYPEKEIIIEESDQDNDYFTYGNEFLVDVFENILINAVKYNERNPVRININLSQINKNDKHFIKIEFQDNGWGISDSMKKTLFKNPIKNKSETKGMGLGLMLSKKILNIYNGEISVEDRIKGTPEQGSNFIINLPLIK